MDGTAQGDTWKDKDNSAVSFASRLTESIRKSTVQMFAAAIRKVIVERAAIAADKVARTVFCEVRIHAEWIHP